LSRGGTQPVKLPDGEERGFLADGDEVILSARASAEGFAPIGLRECARSCCRRARRTAS